VQVVYSPVHAEHDPKTETVMGLPIPANEVAERAERIRAALVADGGFVISEPSEHGSAAIAAVHDEALLRFLAEAWTQMQAEGVVRDAVVAEGFNVRGLQEGMSVWPTEPRAISGRTGYWSFDTSTPIVAGTYPAARAAVDVALTAVDLVLGGATAVYGLCRPPGHHAARSMYGGYCYFNNAAIAAEAVVRVTGEPVAILDVDFHHGNGTQQIFWRRGDVLYVSIHADPDRHYPFFLGRAGETGEGPGAGANLNLPMPAGTGDEHYLAALDRALEAIAATPGSVVIVSLGFDTYRDDPLGDFAVTTNGYHEMGRRVAGLGRRLVIVQEGGYFRPALGDNARAWLRGAEGRPLWTDASDAARGHLPGTE
jgi:acetoin utilization deacetylase AcuC-like enzyme